MLCSFCNKSIKGQYHKCACCEEIFCDDCNDLEVCELCQQKVCNECLNKIEDKNELRAVCNECLEMGVD